MSDVVVVSKQLLERLLETVECNDPRNEFLGSMRNELVANEQLMAHADDIMHKNHDAAPGQTYHELDRDNKRWILMGEFDLDAMKVMTITLANPGPEPEGILVPWSVLGGKPDDN